MKKLTKFAFVGFALLGLLSNPLFAAAYSIDQDHSSVTFKIRHLLSNVQGSFNQFDGHFEYDPEKPEAWQAEATIQTASIDTNVKQRDEHLRNKDFFDVETFPMITFKSTGVTGATPTSAKLQGLLTLHGVEKPVVLDMEIHGVASDPWGNSIASFTATTTVNRKDFGLAWNKAVESGQLLVGEEVTITIDVAGLLKQEPTAATN